MKPTAFHALSARVYSLTAEFIGSDIASGRPIVAAVESSIGDTLRSILKDVQLLVRSELRLARAQLRSDLSGLAKAAAFAGLALVLSVLAVAFTLLAVFFALRSHLPAWLSALLVAVLAGILAGALLQMARSFGPPPALPRTISTVKESIEWAKQRLR